MRLWVALFLLSAGCPSSSKPSVSDPVTPPPQLVGWACYQVQADAITTPSSTCEPSVSECEATRGQSQENFAAWTHSPCAAASSVTCYTFDFVLSDGTTLADDKRGCYDDANECQESRRYDLSRDDRGDVSACVDVATGVALSTAQAWSCFGRQDSRGQVNRCSPSLSACEADRARVTRLFGDGTTDCADSTTVACFTTDMLADDGSVLTEDFVECLPTWEECESEAAWYRTGPEVWADVSGCAAP